MPTMFESSQFRVDNDNSGTHVTNKATGAERHFHPGADEDAFLSDLYDCRDVHDTWGSLRAGNQFLQERCA